jgi:hypothetical protein
LPIDPNPLANIRYDYTDDLNRVFVLAAVFCHFNSLDVVPFVKTVLILAYASCWRLCHVCNCESDEHQYAYDGINLNIYPSVPEVAE